MAYFRFFFVILSWCFTFLMVASPVHTFQFPERLEFEVSYLGIPAGYAVQTISKHGNEIHIGMSAHSADWLNLFFSVDDRMEAMLRTDTTTDHIGMPNFYRERIHEGQHRYEKDVIFNWQKLNARIVDHLKKRETIMPITAQTYDILSSFFYFRTLLLKIDTSLWFDIFDCKRLWNTEVKILHREETQIPLGRFKTVVIKPIFKSQGVMPKTNNMYIWLTDDERHIPILMKFELKVGSIKINLIGGSYWPGGK